VKPQRTAGSHAHPTAQLLPKPNSPCARCGDLSLFVLVDYLELLADARPDKFDRAAVRWHGRLELEIGTFTLAESSARWPHSGDASSRPDGGPLAAPPAAPGEADARPPCPIPATRAGRTALRAASPPGAS
jgi:hypothetical protein